MTFLLTFSNGFFLFFLFFAILISSSFFFCICTTFRQSAHPSFASIHCHSHFVCLLCRWCQGMLNVSNMMSNNNNNKYVKQWMWNDKAKLVVSTFSLCCPFARYFISFVGILWKPMSIWIVRRTRENRIKTHTKREREGERNIVHKYSTVMPHNHWDEHRFSCWYSTGKWMSFWRTKRKVNTKTHSSQQGKLEQTAFDVPFCNVKYVEGINGQAHAHTDADTYKKARLESKNK